MVQRSAASYADLEAIVDGDDRMTYAALGAAAMAATRATIAMGVTPGDRVAVWAPNGTRWILAALGVLGAGGVLVPVNTRFKGGEAADVLRRTDAVAIFTVAGFLGVDYLAMLRAEAPELRCLRNRVLLGGATPAGAIDWAGFLARGEQVPAEVAEARLAAVRPEDVSDIIFTSGTTAHPKGVLLTHGQSLRGFEAFNVDFGLREGDRYLVVGPFFHCMGYKSGWMLCFMVGATCVPVAVFDETRLAETVERSCRRCSTRRTATTAICPASA
jgi:acyl-CoA synthetase (AMP-forming)/AMP-acid ligase II